MSIFNPQFQIVSDLHLETPITSPSYSKFRLNIQASNLCLLGDIGLVKDDSLFTWIRKLLAATPNLKIFYILGNHEPYGIALAAARSRMSSFARESTREFGDRFIFLDRGRYDINPRITVLGCTLWSEIAPEEVKAAALRLTDMQEIKGIANWDVYSHLQEYHLDLNWLNQEVDQISREDPNREILILTHHSPTTHIQANNPTHEGSGINSAFRTDLSSQPCWKSPQVKMWAFGHTHYSCFYSENGKLIVSNQKGYDSIECTTKIDVMVIEAKPSCWERIEVLDESSESQTKTKGQARNALPKLEHRDELKGISGRLNAAWRRLRR
jgi:predicted phosphodiesterase